MTPAVPASEIVREAEAAHRRSLQLREEARRLLAEADAVEAGALARAVDSLGEDLGRAAVGMAAWTVTGKLPEAAQPLPTMGEEAPAPYAPAPASGPDQTPVAPAAPAPACDTQQAENLAPAPAASGSQVTSRTSLHGVDVPPSRIQEAEEIVAQASSLFAQGHKSNPYGSDRGKNAWRKLLFKAAWDHLAASRPAGDVVAAKTSGSPAARLAEEPPRQLPAAVAPPPAGPVAEDLADLDEEEGVSRVRDEDASAVGPGDLDSMGGNPSGDAVEAALPGGDPAPFMAEGAEEVDDDVQVDDGAMPAGGDDETDFDGSFDDEPVRTPSVETSASSGSARAAEPDPFDDLDDELPPASTLPPPRGYAATSPAAPVDRTETNPPVAASSVSPAPSASVPAVRPSAPRMPASPAARPGPPSATADSPVAARPQAPAPAAPRPAVRPAPAATRPSDPVHPAGPIPMHTPVAVPPGRRPGNGQALQRPVMPPPPANPSPASAAGPASSPPRPPARPGRPLPPSFTHR